MYLHPQKQYTMTRRDPPTGYYGFGYYFRVPLAPDEMLTFYGLQPHGNEYLKYLFCCVRHCVSVATVLCTHIFTREEICNFHTILAEERCLPTMMKESLLRFRRPFARSNDQSRARTTLPSEQQCHVTARTYFQRD
jgi:hypothetical protein